MVDHMQVEDAYGNKIETEVGADGKTPVSPNNPPVKAAVLDRITPALPEEDESVGIDGKRVVSPNNPPENTQTVSDDVYGGVAPEGVDDAVVEAALNEQYPVSYNPVKADTADADEVAEDDEETGPPAKSANKPEWVEYAVSQGADRDEAEDATKDELIATYGD